MDEKFWHRRWENNEIGFHLSEPHHYLKMFFPVLQLVEDAAVFVPLCGKSPDLIWLHEQGLKVAGVEFSRTAVESFFSENGLSGEWTTVAGVPCCRAEGYQLYCGDFFKLSMADLAGSNAFYDRASLVALPPERRTRYAIHLAALLPPGGRVLMISYEYNQDETYGPPFSVPRPELEALFGDDFQIELLAEDDVLWSHQGLVERGVTQLTEYAVLMIRN